MSEALNIITSWSCGYLVIWQHVHVAVQTTHHTGPW